MDRCLMENHFSGELRRLMENYYEPAESCIWRTFLRKNNPLLPSFILSLAF